MAPTRKNKQTKYKIKNVYTKDLQLDRHSSTNSHLIRCCLWDPSQRRTDGPVGGGPDPTLKTTVIEVGVLKSIEILFDDSSKKNKKKTGFSGNSFHSINKRKKEPVAYIGILDCANIHIKSCNTIKYALPKRFLTPSQTGCNIRLDTKSKEVITISLL